MSKSTLILSLLILLAAFWLRVWHLNDEPIWHDEGWSIQAIRGPFTTPDDKTPFGYYALMHLLWRGAGESPFALRFGSALIGVLIVAAVVRLTKQWFGKETALTAGVMTATIPLLWAYSQEVRAYIMIPLVAVALLWGTEKILSFQFSNIIFQRTKTFWLILIVEIAALYTHNLAVPLVAWAAGSVALVLTIRRDWRGLIAWIAGHTGVGLLYLPWMLTQSPSGTPLNTPPALGLELARDIWYGYFLPVLPQLRAARTNQILNGLAVILVLGSIAVAIRCVIPLSQPQNKQNRARAWLLITQVAGLPILTTGLLLAAHIDFHPRYYIAAVPGTMMMLAWGISGTKWFQSHKTTTFHQPIPQLWITLITGVIAIVSLQSIGEITSTPDYGHDDFRGLAEYYATLPENTAILLPFQTEPALQRYYAEKVGIQAQFVNVPLYSDETTAIEAINRLVEQGIQQVEFLTWYPLPADERGMYPCLLMAASSAAGQQRTFVGLMTEHYTLIQQIQMQPLQAEPRYANFQLNDAAYASSDAGICIRTDWSVTNNQISVAARVWNPLEVEIARSDAAVMPTNPFQLEDAAAYNRMALPAGTPPTEYPLTLTVYDSQHPNGYDLIGDGGNPVGTIYRLPQAVQAQGVPFTEVVDKPILLSAIEDVTTGIPLNITLLLPNGEGEANIQLGTQEQQSQRGNYPQLAWLRFIIPPGQGGETTLIVDGEALGTYTVHDPPRIFEKPQFEQPIGANYDGVGVLEGVTLTQNAQQLQVSLVWKATATPTTAYTVFVQLVGDNGQVIAQSDRMPVEDTRPTTGWVEGEYLIDTHLLNIPEEIPPGTQLIAGLYDATQPNFPRLLTTEGQDFVKIQN